MSHFKPRSVYCQRAETTVAELLVSSFGWLVPTLFLDSIVSSLQLHWVKRVCVFWRNLPPTLLAEWPGSFPCRCWTRGWVGHRVWVSTQKDNSGEENSPAALLWFAQISITNPVLYHLSYACDHTHTHHWTRREWTVSFGSMKVMLTCYIWVAQTLSYV